MSDTRLKIIRGSDREFFIRITSSKNGAPKDLSSATSIEVILDKSDGSKLILSNVVLPATKAFVTVNNVLFQSVNTDGSGNLIKLIFDGVKTVSQVISDWNTVNPANQVASNATVPQLSEIWAAATYQLSGGYLSYSPVAIQGNALLGTIKVILLEKETQQLKTGNNQSFSVRVDDGQNTSGVRFIGLFENKLDVINP